MHWLIAMTVLWGLAGLVVIAVALVLAFILLRPKQRVKLTDSAPVRRVPFHLF